MKPIKLDYYQNIKYQEYQLEKRRLQIELLNLQEWVVAEGKRLAIVFEGRDAAGKGSTIRRFAENLMPTKLHIIELGIPTRKESRNWFHRYEKHMPSPGEIVFFDRSWYNRALIEPTMGYCKKRQYYYFMNRVVDWEESLIKEGLILIKFYLSVNKTTQILRFDQRISDPLKYWKFSENDLQARKKWEVFTRYKEQMFQKTSSDISPWILVNSNNKLSARLTCMLYTISHVDYPKKKKFKPLKKGDYQFDGTIEIDGIKFKKLNYRQYRLLKRLKEHAGN